MTRSSTACSLVVLDQDLVVLLCLHLKNTGEIVILQIHLENLPYDYFSASQNITAPISVYKGKNLRLWLRFSCDESEKLPLRHIMLRR